MILDEPAVANILIVTTTLAVAFIYWTAIVVPVMGRQRKKPMVAFAYVLGTLFAAVALFGATGSFFLNVPFDEKFATVIVIGIFYLVMTILSCRRTIKEITTIELRSMIAHDL